MSEVDVQNPSDTLGAVVTQIPKNREFVIKRPGNVNIAGDRGNYPGCRLVCFTNNRDIEGLEADDKKAFISQLHAEYADRGATAADLCNLYFKHRANLLVVGQHVDIHGSVWCYITNQLEDEALEDFLEFTRDWEEFSSKRRGERDAKRAEAEAAKQAKVNEDKALVELGRKARDHNLLGKLKELEDELAKTKKELNKLKKGK